MLTLKLRHIVYRGINMSAMDQLDQIDRYLSKSWLDDDYPTDLIYVALLKLAEYEKEEASIRDALGV